MKPSTWKVLTEDELNDIYEASLTNHQLLLLFYPVISLK